MVHKVFLGGTCNESTWRKSLIPLLQVDYYNPVVDDWTPECQFEEIRQKIAFCDVHLYVITPKMTGVFSIAEAIESSMTDGKICVFCIILTDEDKEFTHAQLKSLEATGKMIERHGGLWVKQFESLHHVINKLQ